MRGLTQITGRGYTDSALEKDGAGFGDLLLCGGQPPSVRYFFVRMSPSMGGACGASSDAPIVPHNRFANPQALARPVWRQERQGYKPYVRRHVMSNQSIATSVAPTVPQLRDAIESMDSLSESGFSEIASIAKMALAYLETPNVALHVEDIANALSAIQGKAEDIKNCINYQAEEVGCNYVDKAKIRRLNVWFKGA